MGKRRGKVVGWWIRNAESSAVLQLSVIGAFSPKVNPAELVKHQNPY
jgi:hypothetical protein